MLQCFSVHRQYVPVLLLFPCGSELGDLLGWCIPAPYSTYNGVFSLPGVESPDEVINATIYPMEAVLIMEQLNELSSLGIAEAVGRKVGGLGKGTSEFLSFFLTGFSSWFLGIFNLSLQLDLAEVQSLRNTG